MTTDPKPLNKVEVWVAEHAPPIFGVIAVLIIIGAAAVFWTYQKQGDTADVVKVLKPQVTHVNKAICDRQSLTHPARAARCAERIRVGLVNCRHYQPCRAAWLALATYPPPARTAPGFAEGGDALQKPPNHGHQQPGPGSPGSHGQEPAPAPSPSPPAPPPAPEKPGNGPPVETPGKGPPAAPGGASPSGVGVEVCVLERTCVGLGADSDPPKGLLP